MIHEGEGEPRQTFVTAEHEHQVQICADKGKITENCGVNALRTRLEYSPLALLCPCDKLVTVMILVPVSPQAPLLWTLTAVAVNRTRPVPSSVPILTSRTR